MKTFILLASIFAISQASFMRMLASTNVTNTIASLGKYPGYNASNFNGEV